MSFTVARSYASLADRARDRASEALHQGNPVQAREWIEAATAADKAAVVVQRSDLRSERAILALLDEAQRLDHLITYEDAAALLDATLNATQTPTS
jgi:hypothetical protein